MIWGRWLGGQFQVPDELEEEMLAARSPSPNDPIRVAVDRPDGPQRVWAVVVGVGAYHHMPALRYTDDDAYRFYAFLKSPEGGSLPDDQIRILIDEEATLKHLKETMTDLFGRAGPDDLILLYFSGHGVRGAFLPL